MGLYDWPRSRAAPNCRICVLSLSLDAASPLSLSVNHGEEGTAVSEATVDESEETRDVVVWAGAKAAVLPRDATTARHWIIRLMVLFCIVQRLEFVQ